MRKFDTNIAGFTNERTYNTFLYGREYRFIPYEIDYYRDIKLPILKKYMEEFLSSGCYNEHDNQRYGLYLIDIAQNYFPLITFFLSRGRSRAATCEVSQQIRKNFQEFLNERKEHQIISLKRKNTPENEIQSALSDYTLETWVEQKLKGAMTDVQKMFEILDGINNSFYLDGMSIPTSIAPIMEEYIKKIYKCLRLDGKLDFTFDTTGEESNKEIAEKNGLFMEDNTIVFRGIRFDDASMFEYICRMILGKTDLPNTGGNLIFDNCCFDGQLQCCNSSNRWLYFHNCHFKQSFTLTQQTDIQVVIDNCVISDGLTFFTKSLFPVTLNDSIFESDSRLTIHWIGTEAKEQRLHITDCIFQGQLKLSHWNQLDLLMKNNTFYVPFSLDNTKFGKHTNISNLCFPSVSSPEMEASKKELYDALVASDLKKIAEDLNLPATKKKAKEKNYDYDAYQAELATGWLGSVNASHFYLNKDDSYLSKKRFLEKGKIINTTIPYKGTGKNIQYPVDALQAFKAHDWNKLKELRKKYNFTGDN